MAKRRFALINQNVDESDIIDGGIFARVAEDETISGDWTFTGTTTLPEASITDHEAALTILETQITDGSLLARVAGNEVVTGQWTFEDRVDIDNGATLRVYDATDTDYLELSHTGSLAFINNAALDGLDIKATGRASVRIQTVALADDASTSIEWLSGNGGFAIIVGATDTSIVEARFALIFQQGTGVFTAIHSGASVSTGTANPDVDGDSNYYANSATSLGIKNREGSTANYTVYMFTGDS